MCEPFAVLAIILDEDRTLLIRRRNEPKVWSPPGGYINAANFRDIGPYQMESEAHREAVEETTTQIKPVGWIGDFETDKGLVAVFAFSYIDGVPHKNAEASDIRWFELNDLPKDLSPNEEMFHKASLLSKENLALAANPKFTEPLRGLIKGLESVSLEPKVGDFIFDIEKKQEEEPCM